MKCITFLKLLLIALFIYSYGCLLYAQSDSSIKIIFLGDFNFGESYQQDSVYNRGVNIIDEYGYDYMFENISDLLKKSNLTIANLETPLLPAHISPIYSQKPYVHFSSGSSTIKYLKKYNINALSLANNHTLDLGYSGLGYTINELAGNIDIFGAGYNEEEAGKPYMKSFVISNDTITIAVLTGFEYRKTYDSIYQFYAGKTKYGVNIISIEKISARIKEIKDKYKNVFVIFFPHWGKNYFWKTEKQTETARMVIDAGADLILGTGAHMMQEIEYYNNKWIIYGIGNSIFNAPGRYKYFGRKPYSFIAELNFSRNSKQLKLYPLFTDNLESDYQVRFLDEDELNDCYSVLKNKNAGVNLFDEKVKRHHDNITDYFEIDLK
jgi:hypothetical protein